jgi:hypothetical protein
MDQGGIESKRKRYELLYAQLKNERSSFDAHWKELGDYVLPRRPRFSLTDVNRGDRRNRNIIDSTASLAVRTLRSGMMSGVTSPARPWFRLTTPDPGLSDQGSVKEWLHLVTQRMSTVFLKSNLYNTLPIVYGDLGVFGTAAMYVEEDFDDVIRTSSFPIGSYMISKDYRGKINLFIREFRMTVRQLVEQFGSKLPNGTIDWSNFSQTVKNQWLNGNTEMWIDVIHVISPNEDYDPHKLHSKYKKFSSCYYEKGTQSNGKGYLTAADQDVFLSEKGYDFFPILAPRWEITGEDTYGTECPGMIALGDIKALQMGEKRSAQAIEKMVNPPMIAPTALKNQKASILPGDITYVDIREANSGFRPVHEVNPRIIELEQKQEQIRSRVRRAFYEDLFLMLSTSDRRDFTAREIEERHEEKLLALGPVLEQLNQDLLDPLVDVTFDIMLRQGLVPTPPQEIQGMPLRVEYLSVMAQAQKLVGIAGIERFAGFAGQVAQMAPEILQKIDTDQIIETYADMTSIPPAIIRSDEQTQALRAQAQKQAQAQQATEMLSSGSQAAKNLSQAKLDDGDNALARIIGQ